jgi:Ca2+-binding RTX toxin-like protein
LVGGHTYTITEKLDGSIDVSGVFGNNTGTTTIAVFTNDGYNSVEYTWAAGDTFKIGNFGAAIPSTDPVDFSVPVQVVDGDGDTASGNLNIDLLSGTATQDQSADLGSPHTYTSTIAQPNIIGSAGVDTLNGDANPNTLYGGAGIDALNGNGGNDTLIGNADGDTLNGGAGNDTFVLNLSTLGHDTIADFTSGSDQILVDTGSGLTIGTAATVSATNFHTGDESVAATWNGGTGKEFVFNGTSHELWYSANGTGTDKIDVAHMTTGVPAATDVHTL